MLWFVLVAVKWLALVWVAVKWLPLVCIVSELILCRVCNIVIFLIKFYMKLFCLLCNNIVIFLTVCSCFISFIMYRVVSLHRVHIFNISFIFLRKCFVQLKKKKNLRTLTRFSHWRIRKLISLTRVLNFTNHQKNY